MMRDWIRRLGAWPAGALGAAVLSLSAACSTTPPAAAPVAPTMPTASEGLAPFLLAPGDEVEIKFVYQPSFTDRQFVRPDGKLSLPLVGTVVVAGKTPDELETELREAFASKLDNAELTVIVRSLTERPVYLDGEVNRPQAVPMRTGLTILQAIASAGGTTAQGDLTGVMLMRCQPGRTLEVRELRLKSREDWVLNNVALQPFDIVYVPQTRIAQANQFVDQYFSRMMPDWIHLSFPLSYSLGGVNDDDGGDTTRTVILSGGGVPPGN